MPDASPVLHEQGMGSEKDIINTRDQLTLQLFSLDVVGYKKRDHFVLCPK